MHVWCHHGLDLLLIACQLPSDSVFAGMQLGTGFKDLLFMPCINTTILIEQLSDSYL